MTWVKLSDTFAEDPRLDQAGPLALALHVAALCYCNRQLTDGLIPRATVRRLLDLDDPEDVADRLVSARVWARTDDGFELLDYLRDQPSRAKVEATRAKRAESGRKGGQRSGETRRSNSQATPKQVASRGLEPRPVPKTGRQGVSVPRRCDNGSIIGTDGSCCGEHHGDQQAAS